MDESSEHVFLLHRLSAVFLSQVSSSPQTAGYCHSSHCCHHCCHSSHCCHHCCHSTQSCDDGDAEICGACGGSGSSHHPQNCSSPQSWSCSIPQSWSRSSPQSPGYSRKKQGGT
ncbi:keratin-associated protein 9-3-like isoform X2 [Acomys russatus]|uniref:keratin-associated protein 9-3-like isoform X1 n=1 Tax=Acomys russatus TaxID=60746 RepID=UPI0021E2165B|nr:keratin-associated protein 9-3-like isoform X1 [Acomys russatus]XP_051013597.1 keratin-associated protein 9-3-like isoform X2 [Acomys russatus]